MLNDIPDKQNSNEFLDLLYAYHQAYTNVTRINLVRFGIVTSTALIVPVIGAFFPVFRPYGALISVVVFLSDIFVFENIINEGRKLGARIQELFDRGLFGMSWPSHIVGEKPNDDDVSKLAKKFLNSTSPERRAKMRSWYGDEVGHLSKPLAVLACQRSNCVWDFRLRQRYIQLLMGGLILLFIAGVTFAISLKLSVPEFLLTFIVPSLPAVSFVWKMTQTQKEAITRSERTRRSLDEVRSAIAAGNIQDEIVKIHSEHLQAELFYRRSSVSRVPQFIYYFDREEQEANMEQAVKSMIERKR